MIVDVDVDSELLQWSFVFLSIASPLQRADLQSAQPSDKVMGAQSHMRMVAALQKQIAIVEKKCSEVNMYYKRLSTSHSIF